MANTQTKTVSPASRASHRQKLLGEMTEAAKDLYLNVEQKLIGENLTTIDNRYEIGKMVLEATNKPDTYGKEVHKKYAELLDMNPDVIYQARMFADRFSPEEKDKLKTMRSKIGQPLNWTQIISIARIANAKERWNFIEQALEKNWNTREVEEAIKKARGESSQSAKTSSDAGRPLAKPKSFDGMKTQCDSLVGKMVKVFHEVWLGDENSLIDYLDEMDIENFDEQKEAGIKSTESRLRELSLLSATLADSLATSIAQKEEERQRTLKMPKAPIPSPSRKETVV